MCILKPSIKEYLSKAYYIDKSINGKLEQIQSLRCLATKASATLSDMPKSPMNNFCRMETIIDKMIDLENEINQDIDELVDLKRDIMRLIKLIESPELCTVLELRYLCFKRWEQIAGEMKYSLQHVFRLHGMALSELNLKVESKCDSMRV
jgi:hypothetical protein